MGTQIFNTGHTPLFRIPRASFENEKLTGKVEMIVDDKGIYFKPVNRAVSNPGNIIEPADENITPDENMPLGNS
jgi:hypothetical protein